MIERKIAELIETIWLLVPCTAVCLVLIAALGLYVWYQLHRPHRCPRCGHTHTP